MQELGDHWHFMLSWKYLEASGKNTGPPCGSPCRVRVENGAEPTGLTVYRTGARAHHGVWRFVRVWPWDQGGSTGLWPRSSAAVSAGVTSEYSPQSGPGRLRAPDRRRERAGVCAHAWEDGGE